MLEFDGLLEQRTVDALRSLYISESARVLSDVADAKWCFMQSSDIDALDDDADASRRRRNSACGPDSNVSVE